MTPYLPAAARSSRAAMMAVVLGTAVTAGDASATPTVPSPSREEVIPDLSRYCQACWRNARLPADRWGDCTQQVFTRLLERVQPDRWANLLADDGAERREFIRAIDAVKKRTQRARKLTAVPVEFADPRHDERRDERQAVAAAAETVLSGRQRKIVELTVGGWAVPDIADELGTTPERVSDEKYKAIRKLRQHLCAEERDS